MNQKIKFFLQIGLLLLVLYGLSYGARILPKVQAQTGHQYYVDKASLGGTCSDSNSGAIAQPWCTINKANSTLVAGDTVYIRQGSYQNEVISPVNSGTSISPITFKAYGSELPVLSTTTNVNLIYLNGKNYIKVENLKFENAVTRWGTIENSDNNIFQNDIFTNAGGSYGCFYIDKDSDFNKILGNQISNCGNNTLNEYDVIDIAHNSDDNLIEGNNISNGGHALIGIIGAWSTTDSYYPNGSVYRTIIRNNILRNEWATVVGMGYQTYNNIIENNRIYNASRQSGFVPKVGIQLVSSNNIIRNNFIYNNRGQGILLSSYCYEGTMCQQAVGNQIYNNTIYGNGGLGISVNKKDNVPLKDNIVKNNIVFNNNPSGTAVDFFGTPKYFQIHLDDYHCTTSSGAWPSDYEIENYFNNNLIFHQSATEKIISRYRTQIRNGGGGLEFTLAEAQSQMPHNFYNNIATDPLFNNPKGVDGILGTADDDFSLRSGSPACGAGENGVDLGAIPCGSVGQLTLFKSVDKTSVTPGGTDPYLNYSITYTNNTGAAISPLTITDTVPAGTSFVSAGTGCSLVGSDVKCTISSVASGASGTVIFKVRAN